MYLIPVDTFKWFETLNVKNPPEPVYVNQLTDVVPTEIIDRGGYKFDYLTPGSVGWYLV